MVMMSENKFLNQSKSFQSGMLPRIDSIKEIRQKMGITQKKLGTMTGVSTSMINQI